jgi:hypothetical protein
MAVMLEVPNIRIVIDLQVLVARESVTVSPKNFWGARKHNQA